ncbi:STAS domain-containing protein [Actinokineospora baliensis]|uniref:STAS domain-containing protein n=1 Tax=Actinokineospora baliensis TaxID=547056 RepID=UPI001957A32B|nr:STAS domain-containing protein [Actinokineospora baliensis]
MDGVEIDLAVTERAAVVRVVGDVAAVDVAPLRDRLLAACSAAPEPRVVVVDLTRVALLSAHGARVLTRFVGACARGQVRVCLVADVDGIAHRVLRIAGVSERVPTFPSVSSADEAIERSLAALSRP